MSVEVVFFDAGETLLSPDPSWAGLSARVLRERGHDVDAEELQQAWRDVGSHFRKATSDGVQFSLDADASRSFWVALYTGILERLGIRDPQAPDTLYRTFSDPENYRLFPDALECLHALRDRGYVLGIISNFESWLERLLQKLGIDGLFDVIAISGHLGWEKPDPRIFAWAVERIGRPAAKCVYVGDQPYFDAEPANACGLRGVTLDRFGRYEPSPEWPTITSLSDLPGLVEKLEPAR